MIRFAKTATLLSFSLIAAPLYANGFSPDDHAPIGVMGDHTHLTDEWMISYRFMSMDMEDNLQGDDSISPEDIVTTVANPNAPPPTVRVVPESMTTNMHMFGAMYAVSDTITLMGMVNYLDKEMDHITFQGPNGTNRLGTFTTESSGIGDTKLSAMWNLSDRDGEYFHLNLGLSLPTGSVDESDDVLAPTGATPTLRLPYAMQLGSGTFDLEPGITYMQNTGLLRFGAQYMATLRLGENDEDYTFGDIHKVTGWGSYRFSHGISGSARLTFRSEDSIDGGDDQITAPVTTANPANYGGERVDFGIGVNLVTPGTGHRFGLEYEIPVMQDVNGVQMEMQSMLTLGYQYTFYP